MGNLLNGYLQNPSTKVFCNTPKGFKYGPLIQNRLQTISKTFSFNSVLFRDYGGFLDKFRIILAEFHLLTW